MKYNLFVYGTLMSGLHNHRFLSGAEDTMQPAVLSKFGLFDTAHGYPAIAPVDYGFVEGELYEIDDDMLTRIDMLEGYRGEDAEFNLYNRKVVTVHLPNGDTVDAFTYIWARSTDSLDLVEAPNWYWIVGGVAKWEK
jgi:gamma-glutamylcyclotransferase (GGCT)/AIG2-like uncharacterized protein YtfP